MKISVYNSPPRTARRSGPSWCVTVFNGQRSETFRFETELEALQFAAGLQKS